MPGQHSGVIGQTRFKGGVSRWHVTEQKGQHWEHTQRNQTRHDRKGAAPTDVDLKHCQCRRQSELADQQRSEEREHKLACGIGNTHQSSSTPFEPVVVAPHAGVGHVSHKRLTKLSEQEERQQQKYPMRCCSHGQARNYGTQNNNSADPPQRHSVYQTAGPENQQPARKGRQTIDASVLTIGQGKGLAQFCAKKTNEVGLPNAGPEHQRRAETDKPDVRPA